MRRLHFFSFSSVLFLKTAFKLIQIGLSDHFSSTFSISTTISPFKLTTSSSKFLMNDTENNVIQKCSIDDLSPCHDFARCDFKSGLCECKSDYYGDGYRHCRCLSSVFQFMLQFAIGITYL